MTINMFAVSYLHFDGFVSQTRSGEEGVMPCVFSYLVLFGLLDITARGVTCGLEHCIKCDRDQCTECEYGYYGNRCTKKCQGCWLGGCEQYNGKCIQCAPGYYTESCNRTCPLNCRVSYDSHRYCNRTTGHCLEGCEMSSYWGSQCSNTCSSNCYKSTCEQGDGTCFHGCNDGWFGITCSKVCPENCHPRKCSVLLGECSEGCKHGFLGRMCNISCNNCIGKECTFNELMQLVNCTRGCKDGWSSYDCKQSCNSCLNKVCGGNGNCKACPHDYHGAMCTDKCPLNCQACDRKTGHCIFAVKNKTNDGTKYKVISTQEDISDDQAFPFKENTSAVTVLSVALLWWTYLMTRLT